MEAVLNSISLRTALRCTRLFSAGLLLSAVLSGCTVKLISSYDEQTDKSITALQKNFEAFFVRLERSYGSPACVLDHHKSFYDDSSVELSGIRVRAAAMKNNRITTEQIELLSKSLGTLEQLHRIKSNREPGKNCLSREEIEPLRNSFNASFTAILKLEFAKKRGEAE